MLGWISRINLHLLLHSRRSHQLRGEDVDYPGYDDPHGDMPVDDEDMPPPTGQQPEPDLDDAPVELHSGGDPPSQPPGGGAQVPVPEDDHDDSDLEMPLDSEGHGGGSQRPGPWLWTVAGRAAYVYGV